ncbi:MAG: AAA family ATPase [Candidatus Aenigmarchaeota archaeon]|nr:AAA family ATPase [Candidatus Aenigmarchaeota archaeon]
MSNDTTCLIVFLNGTSSSGKTTIAGELAERLPDFEYLAIDAYWQRDERLAGQLQQNNTEGILSAATDVVYAFHRSIASRTAAGRSTIVDHVLDNPAFAEGCGTTLEPYKVLLVGVYCPLDVAESRERERGDRIPGTARYLFPLVHESKTYDVTVDTSVLSPSQCAGQIAYAVDRKLYADRTSAEKFGVR